jgi:hypothetical protein
MAVKTKAALKAQLESADLSEIGGDLIDSLIAVDRLKLYSFTGRNGAGEINLTGTVAGDTVIGVVGISTPGNVASSFEGTITVTNQIQQVSVSNLSAVTYMLLLMPSEPSLVIPPPQQQQNLAAQLIWYENHEVDQAGKLYGRLSQWYIGQSTPDQDSAEAGTTATRPSDGAVLSQHHTGNYAMRTNIKPTSTGTAGCRTNYSILAETYPFGDFYYGAWYYQPSVVTVGNFWQNWQWKVRNMALSTAPYVAYALYVYNPAPGYMAYRLTYKLGEDAGVPGPHSGGVTVAYSEDSSVLIPVAEWYHLEGYIKPAYDYTGQVIIRMNGVEIFNWNNVITMDQATDRCNAWHITNYGRNLGLGSTLGSGNSTITLYNDDETIGLYDWIYGSAVQPW